MKTSIFITVIVSGILTLTACCGDGKCKKEDAAKTASTETVVPAAPTTPEQNVVTINNKKGESLKIKFADEVADVEFKGEKFQLQEQRTASGVKYANDHFTYDEWQGKITLSKDGKVIFSNQE